MSKYRIAFTLSGSIACFKACALISRLVSEGHEVKTVCTPSALKFIGPATLEGLTGLEVYSDTFGPRQNIGHVSLAKWMDISVICPATANIINKMAAGIGDDCATTLFLSHDFAKPCLVVPAMNVNMWKHPATVRSAGVLRGWGVDVMPPVRGRQACGDEGDGRMPEPDAIHARLLALAGGRR